MHPILLELGPLTVYTYGLLLAAAYLLGLKLAMNRAEARGLDHARVLDLGIYIIIAALIGAKLLLLIVDFDQFSTSPQDLLSLARSGGVFYGGLILAVIVAFWYISRHQLPFWTTCDVFAPGIALGHVTEHTGEHGARNITLNTPYSAPLPTSAAPLPAEASATSARSAPSFGGQAEGQTSREDPTSAPEELDVHDPALQALLDDDIPW